MKDAAGTQHDYSDIMSTLPEGGLEEDEIVLTNFPASESKDKDPGAAFLFASTKDRVYDKNSIFTDLEKYKLGFQHALKLMGYKYKWEVNTCLANTAPRTPDTTLNVYTSYNDWLASEIFTYILNGMRLHFESEDFDIKEDYCLDSDQKDAMYRGLAASVDEVALYATGLSSVVLYTASQEAAKRREIICGPNGIRGETVQTVNPQVLKYASNLSLKIVTEGTMEASKNFLMIEPPAEQPAIEPPEEQPASEPPEEQPAAEPPEEEPTAEPPEEQPAEEPPEEEPTPEPPEEQPVDKPPEEQPAADLPEEQPSAEPPEAQPAEEPPGEQTAEEPPGDQPAVEPLEEQPTAEPLEEQPTDMPTEPLPAAPPVEPPVPEVKDKPVDTTCHVPPVSQTVPQAKPPRAEQKAAALPSSLLKDSPEGPCPDSMVVMVKYLFLEFRQSECGCSPPTEKGGFPMTEFDFATLLRWGIMRYASEVASRLIDSIMKHLYASLQGKIMDRGSECKVESPVKTAKDRQELVKLYVKLYAERLSLRILKEVMGPCYEKYKYNEFTFQPTPCPSRPITAIKKEDPIEEDKELQAVLQVNVEPQPPEIVPNVVESEPDVIEVIPEPPPVIVIDDEEPDVVVDVPPEITVDADAKSMHDFNEKVIENMLSHEACPVKPEVPACSMEVEYVPKVAIFSLDNLKSELEPAIKFYCSAVSEFIRENPGGVIDIVANQTGIQSIDIVVDHLTETGVTLDSIMEARALARPWSANGRCKQIPPAPKKGWTVRLISSKRSAEASEVLVTNQNTVYDEHARQLQAVLQWAAASELGVPKMYFAEADDKVLLRLKYDTHPGP
ncbi:uncharacterized protein [Pleurodeles waltl]|uniref:uncharacterized protein n=1 Tax=Pleurodeles waltl TaxID=8319 RepID=UPI0037098637